MPFDNHIYQQINSSIQQSYQLQQLILSQLGRTPSSQSNIIHDICSSLRKSLVAIQEEILQEWRPFYQQLISIVSRVSQLYSKKVDYLQQCLSESQRHNQSQGEQIQLLKELLQKQSRKTAVNSSRGGQNISQKGTSQREQSESTQKVNISEYISVLNQSLLKECLVPSCRTLELQNCRDYSRIQKKQSRQLENVNFSLQLKKEETSAEFSRQPLREQQNTFYQKQKRCSSQDRREEQENRKRVPSPMSKGMNDSFAKVLKIGEQEWQGNKLQLFRKNFFKRRRYQR